MAQTSNIRILGVGIIYDNIMQKLNAVIVGCSEWSNPSYSNWMTVCFNQAASIRIIHKGV
jgi:hypothetical protein